MARCDLPASVAWRLRNPPSPFGRLLRCGLIPTLLSMIVPPPRRVAQGQDYDFWSRLQQFECFWGAVNRPCNEQWSAVRSRYRHLRHLGLSAVTSRSRMRPKRSRPALAAQIAPPLTCARDPRHIPRFPGPFAVQGTSTSTVAALPRAGCPSPSPSICGRAPGLRSRHRSWKGPVFGTNCS